MYVISNKKKYILVSILLIFFFSLLNYTTGYCNNINNNNKTIYLTFDDGPSKKVTRDILDILKSNNIKATFFLVGAQLNGHEDMVKRMDIEGHSIGLHSYTHNFSKLYKKNKVNIPYFIDEMIKTQNEIEDIISKKVTILRFPGGSHNRITPEMLFELQKHNFKVYDWTHSSEDGVNVTASPSYLFKKSIKKIPSKKVAPGAILLMHCNGKNTNSVLALPKIIKHYKGLGYTFLPITKDTPEFFSE